MLVAGAPLAAARGAMILLHGRGAGAADILGLAGAFGVDDIAYLAPEAAGRVWYPRPFSAPRAENEPALTSALGVVAAVIDHVGKEGIPPEKVAICGFSQGACLTLEFAARNPRRYGAVAALTGALIGERIDPEGYPGSLHMTPVFVASSDVDPYFPLSRIEESVEVVRRMEADVKERIYPGMGHLINEDEVNEVRAMLLRMIAAPM